MRCITSQLRFALASTMRKTKRLRRRLALVLDKLYLQVSTTLSKNGEGRGGAISLVRWRSIGGRVEWGKNKRAECKAPYAFLSEDYPFPSPF